MCILYNYAIYSNATTMDNNFSTILMASIPPIIYLTLNKSIRNDCIFLYKIIRNNKVQQGVNTILVQPAVPVTQSRK
uniref:CPXV160 protein n=1 Tax=Meloidogyne hapla TaxID=6305 RepID=A0A1I8B964_MELHA